MKHKTLTQRTSYECGPIAIRNAMVLLGRKPMSVASLKRICRTDKDGTTEAGMKRGLISTGLGVYPDYQLMSVIAAAQGDPSLAPVVFILGYTVGDTGREMEGHYIAVLFDGQNFFAYNWASDKVVAEQSHKKLKRKAGITAGWLYAKLKQFDAEVYVL